MRSDQQAQELTPEEREAIIAELRPPRRALTKREEGAFEAGRLAVFEQRRAHEAEGKELPPYDEQRIFFRAGCLAARAPVPVERPDEPTCPECSTPLMPVRDGEGPREWLCVRCRHAWTPDPPPARLPEQPKAGIPNERDIAAARELAKGLPEQPDVVAAEVEEELNARHEEMGG